METKKNSLLIVDDEKSNILILREILGQEYTIYAAKNGPDAIEVANERLPDVILLDILMPGMNGYEVITALKSSNETRYIPVIFVTALSEAKDEEKGFLLGAADYINKPFSPAIVKLRVQNQIKMLNYINTISRMGMTDQLTDLPNRRSFEERMHMEWNRAIRDQTPISVLILDIDRFKHYNDTYGHQQGDLVLKIVAGVFMNEIKRLTDFVARFGGEEFVIILANTDSNGAFIVAEHVRKSIENTPIPLPDGQVTNVTISIGVNTILPTLESSMEEFLGYADSALYTAKKYGRNRVCRYNDCSVFDSAL